ncbi:MAG: hypothetical protein ACK4FB_07895 [Brevundimonas sp.]|uniref:hypothetical protein n=1 Tax=Brevundimonas sp. TaxID=1871086 RepID=UPI00391AC5CB
MTDPQAKAQPWTAARERIAKFVSEWPKGSHRGDMIHGLHMGCPRESELRLSDIKMLLDQSAASPDMAEALRDVEDFLSAEFGPVDEDAQKDASRWSNEDAFYVWTGVRAALAKAGVS